MLLVGKNHMKKVNPEYIRNLIFGAEDSLVSTVGVIFGVASAAIDSSTILLTGFIVIAVESLSMGAGAFLSETSTKELSEEAPHNNPIISGVLMFIAYFVTGFIPVSPYMFFEISTAKYLSVGVTFIALFLLGFLPQKRVKTGLRMVVVAGAAVVMGFAIGTFFKIEGI